jgi:hypothetical protein
MAETERLTHPGLRTKGPKNRFGHLRWRTWKSILYIENITRKKFMRIDLEWCAKNSQNEPKRFFEGGSRRTYVQVC